MKHNKSPYSAEYIEEQKTEMYASLANCKTEEEKNIPIKAYQITVNPYTPGPRRNWRER